jgi:phenylalanyl-tRNA synthetase alpha chain
MASELIRELDALESEARSRIEAASTTDELDALRIALIGRKEGRLTSVLRRLGELGPEDRPAVGKRANEVKESVTSLLEAREAALGGGAVESGPALDLTLPGRRRWPGARHPVTQIIDEIHGIFREMGFVRARGPEAETDWHNFEALNTPLDHPAAPRGATLIKGQLKLKKKICPPPTKVS